jgi:hypothetical protein
VKGKQGQTNLPFPTGLSALTGKTLICFEICFQDLICCQTDEVKDKGLSISLNGLLRFYMQRNSRRIIMHCLKPISRTIL